MAEVKVNLLWSKIMAPNNECSYTHIKTSTPIGEARLEWKDWKDDDCVTIQLNNEFIDVADDINQAKEKLEIYLGDKLIELLESVHPTPSVASKILTITANQLDYLGRSITNDGLRELAKTIDFKEGVTITIEELKQIFPSGIPIIAMKILFPDKSEKLNKEEMVELLTALSDSYKIAESLTIKHAEIAVNKAKVIAKGWEENLVLDEMSGSIAAQNIGLSISDAIKASNQPMLLWESKC